MTEQTQQERLQEQQARAQEEQAKADDAHQEPAPDAQDDEKEPEGMRKIMVMHTVRFGVDPAGDVSMRATIEDLDEIRSISLSAVEAAGLMKTARARDVRELEMRPAICVTSSEGINIERVFLADR